MADAEVGDDVYGEDPTVNRLQSLAAGAARQGGRALRPVGNDGEPARDPRARARRAPRCCARTARTSTATKRAAAPVNSGVQMHPLWDVPDGIARRDRRASRITCRDPSLLVIENTYMAVSGAPIDADEMRTLVRDRARRRRARARRRRAHLERGDRARRRRRRSSSRGADTVMFCLSKGLSAPVGSLLVRPGRRDRRGARATRRAGAAAMRQAGRHRGGRHRRARDDGRTARRRSRARAPTSPTRSPSAGRAASIRRPCARTSCARDAARLPEQLRRPARRSAACGAGTIDPRTVRLVTHKTSTTTVSPRRSRRSTSSRSRLTWSTTRSRSGCSRSTRIPTIPRSPRAARSRAGPTPAPRCTSS